MSIPGLKGDGRTLQNLVLSTVSSDLVSVVRGGWVCVKLTLWFSVLVWDSDLLFSPTGPPQKGYWPSNTCDRPSVQDKCAKIH